MGAPGASVEQGADKRPVSVRAVVGEGTAHQQDFLGMARREIR